MRSLLLVPLVGAASGASRFTCPKLAVPPPPRDISELHPAHVSLVMAVGDSITAAFSARSTLEEARDISWSIGSGSAEQLTLPWLLQQYNPTSVEGASTTARLPRDISHLPHNDYAPKTDHLNVAESSGAAHRGSLEEQWAFIDSGVAQYSDLASRWKVLTVWMMANDVCGECGLPIEQKSVFKTWVDKMDLFLTNVTTKFNNIYINLVSTLDLSQIARIQKSKAGCELEHRYILEECGCIDRGNVTQLAMLDRNVHTMNNRQHQLARDWSAKLQQQGRKDVAVVVQYFMEGIGSNLDWTFLSRLDCFHPAQRAHEDLAVGLWNSMLCTEGRQQRCGNPFSPNMNVTCPTASSVFYTGPDVTPDPPSFGPSAESALVV